MDNAVEPEPVRSEKAGVLARVLGLVAALVLAFLAAVAVIAMIDIAGLTPCHDANRDLNFTGTECFDGSKNRQILSLALGFPGAALAVISVGLALAFVIRGRGLRPLIITAVAGAVLFGLAILVGSI